MKEVLIDNNNNNKKNNIRTIQTKKKSPFFMVFDLSIRFSCPNKNKTKMFPKRPTHEHL